MNTATPAGVVFLWRKTMKLLIDQVQNVQPQARVGRYPRHTFQISTKPYVAAPFMIAPTMPQETLKNIFFESRVVTDPILSSIIGWKQQYFFYWVSMSDLLIDAMRQMFIDPTNTDIASTQGLAANDQFYYTAKGGVPYAKLGVQRIVDHYFRADGEAPDDYKRGATEEYLVQYQQDNWMDSLTDKDAMPEGATISTATDAGDLQRLMLAFEQLRALGVANMTYEDWLRSNGINVPNEQEQGKPLELGYFSDFQYPSNTINPVDGIPASAVSWVFKNGNSERRFFKEPGFIIGLAVTRPKVYWAGLAGNAAAHLTRAWDWSPNYLWGHPETTLKNFAGDTGPLGDRTIATDGYFVDMRDIFLYGDQWQNVMAFAPNVTHQGANHMVASPTGDTFRWRYPTDAECRMFFKDPTNASNVRHDGYVNLSIDGHMVDTTIGRLAPQ